MNLQIRLTLYFVLLAVLLVIVISVVDLAHDVELQFDTTLDRADSLRTFASDVVVSAVARQPDKSLREALRDPDLTKLLQDTMLASSAILEIAVVDTENEVLADSVPDHLLGDRLPAYEDFRPVVRNTNAYHKVRALYSGKYYQLENKLGRGAAPILYVRVVIAPTLIREKIMARLRANAIVALIAAIAAMMLTFLVSAFAFRPLSRLREQLELVASG